MRSQWFLASCLFWLLLKRVWRGNLFPSLGLRYNCLERLRGLTRLLSLSIEKLRSALTGSITTEGRSWCINLISFSIWGECRCILEFIVLVGKITLLLLDIGWSTYNIRLLLLVIALIDIKMEISIFKIGPHILSFFLVICINTSWKQICSFLVVLHTTCNWTGWHHHGCRTFRFTTRLHWNFRDDLVGTFVLSEECEDRRNSFISIMVNMDVISCIVLHYGLSLNLWCCNLVPFRFITTVTARW